MKTEAELVERLRAYADEATIPLDPRPKVARIMQRRRRTRRTLIGAGGVACLLTVVGMVALNIFMIFLYHVTNLNEYGDYRTKPAGSTFEIRQLTSFHSQL